MTELDVYRRFIDFLEGAGWRVLCASPPAGTDARFRKCLLPRRRIGVGEKGPRDEVDITAVKGQVILLAECKETLSDSLTVLNALGESDREKLLRLRRSFPPKILARLLERGLGVRLPESPEVALALVVGSVDRPIVEGFVVIEVSSDKVSVHGGEVAKSAGLT